MNVREEFNCVGYFGFGNGVYLHREGPPGAGQPLPTCSECPAAAECWTKHRDRVRTLFPDLMGVLDRLTATGLRGGALVTAYAVEVSALLDLPPNKVAPPEMHVMLGNLEDGSRIAAGMEPQDRGPGTLRYPFES